MNSYTANIKITLRSGILDVQGKTVEKALHSIGYNSINNVRIGKYVTLTVEADSMDDAKIIIDNACKELIANPIIEDYFITIG